MICILRVHYAYTTCILHTVFNLPYRDFAQNKSHPSWMAFLLYFLAILRFPQRCYLIPHHHPRRNHHSAFSREESYFCILLVYYCFCAIFLNLIYHSIKSSHCQHLHNPSCLFYILRICLIPYFQHCHW